MFLTGVITAINNKDEGGCVVKRTSDEFLQHFTLTLNCCFSDQINSGAFRKDGLF